MRERQIRFKFQAKKAAQAAQRLLRLSDGTRNYMELVKLMYLADRAALLQLGCPITGDRFVSLEHGMILSRILNLIKEGPGSEEDAPWFQVVAQSQGYEVKLVGEIGDDELSGAECTILDETFQEFGRLDWKQLSRVTHELREWTDPSGGAITVAPAQILKMENWSEERIDELGRELELSDRLDREVALYREED